MKRIGERKGNSRIETMLSRVLLHEIMRQLMRNNNPPIRPTCNPIPLLMQLHPKPEITKYTPAGIKRNRAATLIIEYVQCFPWEVVHIGYFVEEHGEGVEGGGVGREEGSVWCGERFRDEDPRAV